MKNTPTIRLVALLALVTLGSCRWAVTHAPPADPLHTVVEIPASEGEVFDAALAAAHELNLEVKVLEKASGLIRFERASLSARDLDLFCAFPFVFRGRGYLPTSFTQLAARPASSVENAVLSMTLLVGTADEGESKLDLRSAWTASIWYDERNLGTHSLRSTTVFEQPFLDAVRQRAVP